MIRCIRIWTGPAGHSLFEAGTITLPSHVRGDAFSVAAPSTTVSFRETAPGGAFTAHQAPTRQLVLTLSGTLEFQTATGASFTIHPGDILFAEDTHGSGHSWRLIDAQPWRRAYIVLESGAAAAPLFSPEKHHD